MTQDAIKAALPPDTLGSHFWAVVFEDTEIYSQFGSLADGTLEERSIDLVHDLEAQGKRVMQLVLTPKYPNHTAYVFEFRKGDRWHKKWVRSFEVSEEEGTVTEQPIVEAIGIKAVDSEIFVWTYIYADGTTRITTHPEV